jgi:hypothetical protein
VPYIELEFRGDTPERFPAIKEEVVGGGGEQTVDGASKDDTDGGVG